MELPESIASQNSSIHLKNKYDMKPYCARLAQSAMASTLLFLIMGCERKNSVEPTGPKADMDAGIITNEDLGESISVREARELNKPKTRLVMEGFIGGRKKPFSTTKAVFTFGDDSLETCDEIPGDNCPTPWDACCEDRRKINSSTISVQVLNKQGELMSGTLKGVNGLLPGKRIRILATVDEKSIEESMIVNAEKIKVL